MKPSKLVIKCILPLFLLSSGLVNSADKKQPNILFIMVDDLGWNDIGVYGDSDIDTPNLDKLASQGMMFHNAYASAPVCSPSRAGAITGQAPARLRLTNHISRQHFAPKQPTILNAETLNALPNEAVTFAEVLKADGYATAFFGKWHLSLRAKGNTVEDANTLPDAQGFDYNYGGGGFGGPPSWFSPYKNPYLKDGEKGEYLPTRLANEVIGFMKNNQEQPFLAVMWSYLVHSPLKAQKHLIEKYQKRKKLGKKVGMPVYAAMVEAMDTSIGKVLTAVDELELANDTLIVFTSDNGGLPFANNGELSFSKGYPYEGGIRVPMMVRWPGKVQAGVESDISVINTDLFPTFLAAANAQAPKDIPLDGENLLPLLTGQGDLKRDALYFHYPNYAWHAKNRLAGAVVSGDYKLINNYDDDSVELYNLNKDAAESENLAEINPILASKLKLKLKTWLKSVDAAMPIKVKK